MKVPRDGADAPLARVQTHPADLPFGGKVVVLAGHWAQTLPVVPRGRRAHVTAACLFRQSFWQHVHVHRLEHNFRLQGGGRTAAYAALLDNVGYGRGMVDTTTLGTLPPGGGEVTLPGNRSLEDPMVMPAGSDTNDLCSWVYDGVEEKIAGMRQLVTAGGGSLEGQLSNDYFQWWRSRAILAPHRVTVGAVNEVMAQKFPGRRVAMAEDTIDDADEEGCDPGSGFSPDQLSTRTPSGCPPHTLQLAVGMPIMATANMPGVGVYNGTRLIITSIVESAETGGISLLGCAYCDGDGRVHEVDIHRHAAPTNDAAMSFMWTRRQFPIMPCFGMTIKCVACLRPPLLCCLAAPLSHCPTISVGLRTCVRPHACAHAGLVGVCVNSKSQGQTLENRVGVLLTSSVWTHGLLYVALGRVVKMENIRVLCPAQGRRVINVVYADVLLTGEARL